MKNENTITVKKAAELLGVSEQAIRVGLANGTLAFGYAVKMKRTVYIIPKEKFVRETGIEVA